MDLIYGILHALTPANLLYCLAGCVLGTLVGVLPGLGTASTLAILLPLTLHIDPTGSIIMLAGLYYGAQYGGSTTSILVNIPGEVSSVPTCFDGFQMTRQGRAGEALWIAAVGSFIAGTLGALGLSVIGPGLARFAFQFGPPEYFALILFSMTALISFSGSSLIKGVGAALLGIILASIGVDPVTGTMRLNFGSTALTRGFDIVPVAVGLFGIGEILTSSGQGIGRIFEGKLGKMMPRGKELKKGLWASLRGTAIGFPLGMLPGVTTPVASFLAYDLEKRFSKHPEKFGTGMIEGVAAPEAANNATAQAGFIPLMVFGIPTGPSPAIILAALMLYGLQPGPLLFTANKEFAWTIIGSMYVGNVILLILNLPLVGLWARISQIPYKYLAPIILGVCVIGAYSPRNTMFDVWVAFGFGLLAYVMRRNGWPLAPLILGFILGPMLELGLRQSLNMEPVTALISRPIVVTLFLAAIAVVVISLRYLRRLPEAVREEEVS